MVGSRVFVRASVQVILMCLRMGVFRYSSRAKYESRLSRMAFLIRFFTVWMALFAMPLDCGQCGLTVLNTV